MTHVGFSLAEVFLLIYGFIYSGNIIQICIIQIIITILTSYYAEDEIIIIFRLYNYNWSKLIN